MGRPRHIELIADIVSGAGLKLIARVWDTPRAIDFAVLLPSGEQAVLRYVDQSSPEDWRALETMLREGDFDRALLVLCGRTEHAEIEACSIDELPEVLASWTCEAVVP
ncbi:MAG: hypothetical protein BroJett013_25870 [Alphaproteobacteria bacterium]|nr:MAG: hypothetical protein BroJett013_25870 [Alphaproteobacteria bacterium]